MNMMSKLTRLSFSLPLFFAALAHGQYKVEGAGAAPAEVAPAIGAVLQKDGSKVTNGGAAYCSIWLRTDTPKGGKPAEENQTLTALNQGALLGVIRWDAKGQDRRGQGIKPGVYTLRYGLIPINGDHQGAAPQRDFVVMIPAAADTDLNAMPAFDQMMDLSRKASGTPHPAVLSLFKADADIPAGVSKQGENDWVLLSKLGGTPVALIVAGIAVN